ncbi:MAG: aminoacyl-tRNA hydrolase [Ruminococcus sp.]|nr:aminoacyl-tRNA hydrolase [Ruminococcus sp.]
MFGKKKFSNNSIEFIVVGLGNPDRKYENTRHNIGFRMLDYIADKCSVRVNRIKFKSLVGEARLGSHRVLLMKPSTYMNNSGQAVVEAMNFYKIPAENVVILLDDINLDVGKMRIRQKGSDGGQNGMKNIIYLSGSDRFPRVKIGIGNKPNPNYDLAAWVLSKFTKDENKLLEDIAEKVCDSVSLIVDGKIQQAMNNYN